MDRIKPLTSIRGLAAFWVYIYHSQYLHTFNPVLKRFIGMGFYGVDIFFFLSGFIICHAHLNDFVTRDAMKKNFPRFIALRLARIYPMHIMTILLILALQQINAFGGIGEPVLWPLMLNVLLLQSAPFAPVFSLNLVSWSISVEWMLYICFPLVALVLFTKAKSVASHCIIILLALAFYKWHGVTVDRMYVPGDSILRGAFEFTIGAALYNLYRLQFLSRLPWDSISFLCPCCIFYFAWHPPIFLPAPEMITLSLFGLWIYALANAKGIALKFYSHFTLVYLGTISYSFYMLHFILGCLVWRFIIPHMQNTDFYGWEFPALTAGFLLAASLGYHVVENPARQWAKRKILEASPLCQLPATVIA